MLTTARQSTLRWVDRLVPASPPVRQRLLPRVASGMMVLLVALAVVAQLHSAHRLREVQRATVLQAPASESATAPPSVAVVGAGERPGIADARRLLVADLGRIAALQSGVAWLLAIAGAGALLLLSWRDRAARQATDESLVRATQVVDAMATGTIPLPLHDGDAGALGDLNASLRRLAHQLRTNTEVAHALADGAFRRAGASRPAADPMGRALERLTRTMEATATTAQRIARGDLAVRITPQSDDDAFGQACSAMVRRVKHVLREIEETRVVLGVTIAQLRGDAESLAAASVIEADALRRTLEQMTRASRQATVDVARASELAEHAASVDTVARDGAEWFESSLAAVKEVLVQGGEVQDLARDTQLLAIDARRAPHDVSMEARALALAADAARLAARVDRLVLDGSDSAHASAVALDRVQLAVQRGATIVRELEATVREQADRIREADGTVSTAQDTASANAALARRLAARIDTLSAQVRQLDGVLQRFGATDVAVHTELRTVMAADARPVRTNYPTPPHAFMAFPALRMVAGR